MYLCGMFAETNLKKIFQNEIIIKINLIEFLFQSLSLLFSFCEQFISLFPSFRDIDSTIHHLSTVIKTRIRKIEFFALLLIFVCVKKPSLLNKFVLENEF